MDPIESHAARKEALDALRPLVATEESRMTNINARALGVISASSVVTAIAAFFAKDVLAGSSLEKLKGAKDVAVILLILAVVLLALAVAQGVNTLWPRKGRPLSEPDGLAGWAKDDGTIADDEYLVRQQTLSDLAALLPLLRAFNHEKVKRLKTTYALYALAVAVIAADACVFFVAALER